MLGIGWTEMLVIGVVALIVIGPKELPAVMKRIGQFAGTIRRMGSDFQRELNKTTGLNEIANLRNSVTQPLKATAEAIRKEFNTTTAAGKVEPSGALKPTDPKVESVVDEIKAKAGMPAEKPAALPLTAAAAAAMKSAEAAPAAEAAAAPVKAKRAPRVKVPADKPVETAELPAVKAKPPASKTTAAKAPPAKASAAKTASAKPAAKAKAPQPAAEKTAAAAKKPAAASAKPKPAATAAATKTPAATKPRAKPASDAPASTSGDPAPKPAARPRKPAIKKA